MIIDFNKISEVKMDNFRGGLKQLYVKSGCEDNMGKISMSRLAPGASIGYHQHVGNCEVMFILSGSGISTLDGVEEPISAGMCQYCEEGHFHGLLNTGDEDILIAAVIPFVE